jgi:hypothetical protein
VSGSIGDRLRRVALIGGVIAGLSASAISVIAPAGARPGKATGYGVAVQAVFDPAGHPVLVANFTPNGSLATPRFSVCRPDRGCESLAARQGPLRSGPEPPGTLFIAAARYRGRTYTASVTWLGQPHATTSPGVLGAPRKGQVLRPIAARWHGGWSGDFDQLGVEACRTASGKHCRMLGGGELGCPDGSSSPVIGDWFAGWYVFALDARLPRDTACAGTGYDNNASLPVWPLGPTVIRSTALGRIVGERPSVRFLRPAVLRRGRLYVTRVHCLTRCRVSYVVSDRDTGKSGRARFAGTRLLGVSARGLRRGELNVEMFIDDSPRIAGTTRF